MTSAISTPTGDNLITGQLEAPNPNPGDADLGGQSLRGQGGQEPGRLHPSTEVVLLLCGLLLVYGIPSPVIPAAVLLGAAVSAVISQRVRFAGWLLTFLVLAGPMLVMVGIIQGLFYPGDHVTILWEAGPAEVTVEGLAVAIQLWLRVAAMVGLCALFAFGSDAARVFDGLIGLRLPLSLAYICSAAMSLIPMLRQRTRQTLDARSTRGWETNRLSVRLRLMPGIIAGLLTTSLVQLDQRHDAVVQRGFGRSRRPGAALPYPNGAGQRIARWMVPVVVAILVVASLADVLPLPSTTDLIGDVGA